MDSFKEYLKSLGIFYILILMIISIPLLVVLIVLGIKTIVDLRYWLLGAGFAFLSLISIFIYKHRKKYKEELRKDKEEILKILEHAVNSGHDVDISFMGGLLKISYRASNSSERNLPPPKEKPPFLPKPLNNNPPPQ